MLCRLLGPLLNYIAQGDLKRGALDFGENFLDYFYFIGPIYVNPRGRTFLVFLTSLKASL